MIWLPLESNPDVMNSFIHAMGVKSSTKFVDVYGFDADMLAMVPRPALSLILLFPVNEEKNVVSSGDTCPSQEKGIYFMHQTIQNACGTMAIIHAIANNTDRIEFDDKSMFKKFIDETINLDPKERSAVLESSQHFEQAHEQYAQQGQTSAPEQNSDVDFHFVAFIEKNNRLYEMDGRKEGPVCHGTTTRDTFLEDAGQVCLKFIDKCSQKIHFSAVALVQE